MFAGPNMTANIDTDGTIKRANSTLDATRRLGHDMPGNHDFLMLNFLL